MSAYAHTPYSKPQFEVADIFRLFGDEYRKKHKLPLHHHEVINDIQRCRTSALGGHVDECDNCRAQRISYNSCRNRHCPKCQYSKRVEWVEARKKELLPIQYFHVVFTLPDEINTLAQRNQALIYDLLFKAASQTLLDFGHRHLNGELGVTAVLHTWGQTLHQHIHLHCIVTGGALSKDGQWRHCKNGFLFPVKAMSIVFRAKYCEALDQAFINDAISLPTYGDGLCNRGEFARAIEGLKRKEWVVYSKRPFCGPERVIDYIGRYTHRVAISNRRILNIKDGKVTFRYKDYRDGDKVKTMTLSGEEFIRRFLKHVLPKEFVRIRYYGLLANGRKKANLRKCREILGEGSDIWQQGEGSETAAAETNSLDQCLACGVGRMVYKQIFKEGEGPPELMGELQSVA